MWVRVAIGLIFHDRDLRCHLPTDLILKRASVHLDLGSADHSTNRFLSDSGEVWMLMMKSDVDAANANGSVRPACVASAVHLLHRAGQCADEMFSLSLATGTMTPRQYAVMKAVEASTEPSQTTLVELTGIDRSTVADIVRRLVERGLIQRRRTRRDARMYALRMTVKGQAALRVAEPAAATTDEKLLASLGPDERAAFIASLAKIVSSIGPISSARVAR
jgi:DNA-binding MarR family transcriptional regulator